jgi:hypothetical protein
MLMKEQLNCFHNAKIFAQVLGWVLLLNDYTIVPDKNHCISFGGLLIMEQINTRIPDKDQAIEW